MGSDIEPRRSGDPSLDGEAKPLRYGVADLPLGREVGRPTLEGSSWSARSAARTNDLDAEAGAAIIGGGGANQPASLTVAAPALGDVEQLHDVSPTTLRTEERIVIGIARTVWIDWLSANPRAA